MHTLGLLACISDQPCWLPGMSKSSFLACLAHVFKGRALCILNRLICPAGVRLVQARPGGCHCISLGHRALLRPTVSLPF